MKKVLLRVASVIVLLFVLLSECYTVCSAQGEDSTARQSSETIVVGGIGNSPEITAPSAILMEAKRGQVLYQKQANQKLHISSANKIMTAILAIDKNPDLYAKVTVSRESTETEGSALSLHVGEKYTVEELLYAMMLANANDATMALAEFVGGGDVNKFVSLMNSKANELNLKDTYFTNPTGLYDEKQYTTAYDVALLTRYAINNIPAFNRIFSAQAKPWTEKDGNIIIMTSQNELFWSYEGVDGGKTGYNEKEKQTAITTATRGNQRLICVVLDASEKAVFEESAKLLDYGFNSFRTSILVHKGYPQKSVQIGDKMVNLISVNDVYYTHPIGDSYIKSVEFSTSGQLNPPITKDMIIGTAKYVLTDNTVIEINLYPDIEIPLPEDFYTSAVKKIKENRDIFILLALLAAIEVILIIYKIYKCIYRLIKKTIHAHRPNELK